MQYINFSWPANEWYEWYVYKCSIEISLSKDLQTHFTLKNKLLSLFMRENEDSKEKVVLPMYSLWL